LKLRSARDSSGERTAWSVGRDMAMANHIPASANDIYSRFLKGENVSDDEDEYLPPSDYREGSPSESNSAHSSDSEDDAEDLHEDDGDSDHEETVNLYSDLLHSSTSSSAPVLLAHMAVPTASPLTRRRYNRMISTNTSSHRGDGKDADEWLDFLQGRRSNAHVPAVASQLDAEHSTDMSRFCVICTTEARDVICWPCRCLAICDDCRENMASRFAASKHSCPCCRRSVEGYSRIYVP